MLCLTWTMISSVDLADCGVSCAKNWVFVDCGTRRQYLVNITGIVKVKDNLSYDVAVIQCIQSCHKNLRTTCIITLWCLSVMSFTTSMSTMSFPI